MLETLVIGPAHPDEWAAALNMVFRHVASRDERETRVANALQLIRAGELDAAGVLVAREGTRLRGTMVCLLAPGASALVWPPQALSSPEKQHIEDQLMRFGIGWVKDRGAKLAQTLLSPREHYLGAALERNGLAHVTSLWYLRHDLKPVHKGSRPGESLVYRTYNRCDRDIFHETLLRTYEGTSDCPEVNGVRSLQEILEGHQAQGSHNPERWWLASAGGQPVGVLLLTEIPEWHGWDVSYLGVVPAARRCGIGKELTRKAIEESRAAGAGQLTLAVDTRNRPAWDLYTSFGFEPYDQREVYLAIWNHPAGR
jgi:mycothiol synthase